MRPLQARIHDLSVHFVFTHLSLAIAAAQALSSVYMLRTTSNSPHAWTFFYSSFTSFYYLADAVRISGHKRV